MKKYLFLVIVFFILVCNFNIYAQYPEELLKWRVGQKIGPVFYHGDLQMGTGFSNEGYLERKFTDNFSLMGTIMFGTANSDGEVIKTTTGKEAGLNFKSNLLELLLHSKYYFYRKERLETFGTFGLGMLFYWIRVDGNNDGFYESAVGWDGDPDEQKGSSVYRDGLPIGTMEIPFGLGLNYSLNDYFDLVLSYTYKITTTDHIDAVDVSSGISANSYKYATNPNEYSLGEFQELTQIRRDKSKTSGDDNLSVFNIGFAIKFSNSISKEQEPVKELTE